MLIFQAKIFTKTTEKGGQLLAHIKKAQLSTWCNKR
jgi:hypothetical protein